MLTEQNKLSPLERCIYPLSIDSFLDNYWEKSPLYNIGVNVSDQFSDLLSLDEVDEIISSSNLRYPFFRILKDGQRFPIEKCTTAWTVGADVESGLADLNVLYDQFANGATIELQAMERNCLPLMVFCNLLEKQTKFPVRSIIYLTPKNSSGFQAHYDTHDTIILQISGKKKWKVWGSPFKLPLSTQFDNGENELVKKEVDNKVPDEFTMAPGDSIYLPRGYIHKAFTEEEHSLSISIGVMVHRWIDIFHLLVQETLATNEVATLNASNLSSSLMQNVGSFEDRCLSTQFSEISESLLSNYTYKKGLELVNKRFITTRRPSARGRLLDIESIDNVSSGTKIYARSEMVSLIKISGEYVILTFNNAPEVFASNFLETLEFMSNTSEFCLEDIPGNITNEDKMQLVKHLIKVGYLTLHNDLIEKPIAS